MSNSIKLSICIATLNRADFIAETLETILQQIEPGVELVILDGNSSDNTSDIVTGYASTYPNLNYICEEKNSGVDVDYDKAVLRAKGDYCWLMTDDDLLKPNAIKTVLASLATSPDLTIVNAEVLNADFSKALDKKLIKIKANKTYGEKDHNIFLKEIGHGLSFIGCVVIKRSLWLARSRKEYYGTLFIHAGVILQQPYLEKINFISEPLISIRYGNAMWTPRGLEIWLFKWPSLIWSFKGYSDESKSFVCPIGFIKRLKSLLFYRATGAYGYNEFKQFFAKRETLGKKTLFLLAATTPKVVINVCSSVYCVLTKKSSKMAMYSLSNCKSSNIVTKICARIVGVEN
jgi:glycosyltransferase involved in cell wall biosynthesis